MNVAVAPQASSANGPRFAVVGGVVVLRAMPPPDAHADSVRDLSPKEVRKVALWFMINACV